jgi:hypothetical protein
VRFQVGINKRMKHFLDFIKEETAKHRGLHVFDVDDTLFHTTAKIRVMKGKKHVASLSNSEYNTHTLPPGHHYDYTEFRSSEKFAKESKPNARVLNKMKRLHSIVKNAGGKVIINTARADFDDKDKFLGKFRHHGVDIDNIHVHRAGNLKTGGTVAERKASIIRDQIKKGNYTHVSLYDDSEHNLHHFLKLKSEFPHIQFNAHHVKPDGKFKRYTG